MLVLLYGLDIYRSRLKLNEIIEEHKKAHQSGLNLKYLKLKEKRASTELSRMSFQDFKDEIQAISMFDEKKLIILEEAFVNQDFKENFLKQAKSFIDSKDVILFYEKLKIPENSALLKILRKHGKVQEFEPLEGQRLKAWAKKEFEKYQAQISSSAIEQLVNYIGNDLWQFSNEIKKLVSFKKKKTIELEDVELLVRPKIESDIFKTIDAIALKNKKEALILIHKHLEKGDNPLYLLSMITFQFRNLLIVKDLLEKGRSYAVILKLTKLHPFVVKKTLYQAARFNLAELKKIYQQIFQADLTIKKGKIDPKTALDLFVFSV